MGDLNFIFEKCVSDENHTCLILKKEKKRKRKRKQKQSFRG
jgi:hypothetical protein